MYLIVMRYPLDTDELEYKRYQTNLYVQVHQRSTYDDLVSLKVLHSYVALSFCFQNGYVTCLCIH